MINWIKQQFCKHNIEIIEDEEIINLWWSDYVHYETRKYMICTKCGWKKKVSKK